MSAIRPAWITRPFPWAVAVLALLVWGLPHLKPWFAAAFPELDRPMYEQDSFAELTWAHLRLVALSSGLSTLVGVLAGVGVTRAAGREFRPTVETLVAMGQTFPPVAVLAIAAPLIGFGETPALIALALYGLLPVMQQTVAGLESVPAATVDAARGLGLEPRQVLWRVELPLAFPVILSGIRTSVIINIGTAAIASTVGARTLGSPIIVGLSGFNTAYVLQGALLVGWLAVTTDLAFAQWLRRVERWQGA